LQLEVVVDECGVYFVTVALADPVELCVLHDDPVDETVE
jgi:hypothetical protein